MKKCKELTRNYHTDSNYYSISYDNVEKINNDLSDDEDEDDDDDADIDEPIINVKQKNTKQDTQLSSDLGNELTEELVC